MPRPHMGGGEGAASYSSVRSLSKNFAMGKELRSVPESECKGRDFPDNGKNFQHFFLEKGRKKVKKDWEWASFKRIRESFTMEEDENRRESRGSNMAYR